MRGGRQQKRAFERGSAKYNFPRFENFKYFSLRPRGKRRPVLRSTLLFSRCPIRRVPGFLPSRARLWSCFQLGTVHTIVQLWLHDREIPVLPYYYCRIPVSQCAMPTRRSLRGHTAVERRVISREQEENKEKCFMGKDTNVRDMIQTTKQRRKSFAVGYHFTLIAACPRITPV